MLNLLANSLSSDSENKQNLSHKFLLSHLLPYDTESKKQERLKSALCEYKMLLVAAEEAMLSFTRQELSCFDPLVGENSCQIRAVKIALIASQTSFDVSELIERISYSKSVIEKLFDFISELSKKGHSLKYCLENFGIDVVLNCDSIFLIKSYILSKVKVLNEKVHELKLVRNEKTDPKLIKEFGDVGREFSDNLIRYLREQLSKSSLEFVQQISTCPLLPEKKIERIIKDFSISHKGLHCAPFYWMTKLIMHKAVISKIPIVMLAEQIAKDLDLKVLEKAVLYFQPTDFGYRSISRKELDENQPVMVFNVISCRNSHEFSCKELWKKELTEYDLIDLVLACNAAHPQYPDLSKDHLARQIPDDCYNYHLEKSKEWSCCLEDPFRFFLVHVYCDSLKNI